MSATSRRWGRPSRSITDLTEITPGIHVAAVSPAITAGTPTASRARRGARVS